MKNIVKYIISLAVAGGLMWYVFKDMDLAAMWAKFQNANHSWLILVAIFTIIAAWSRAYRWNMLLEPVGYKPSGFNSTVAVFTGYFANQLIPRAGEVTRCGTLNRLEKVPVNVSFGTVVAERVFDVVSLLLLIGLAFVLEFGRLSDFFMSLFGEKLGLGKEGGSNRIVLLAGVGVIGIGLAVAAWWFYRKNAERLRQNALFAKIEGFVLGLVDGLLSIRKLRSPAAFVFHTVLIWVMYFLSSYVCFFVLPESSGLSLLAGLTVLIMGGLGMSAPVQGGIGPYHILVSSALVLYGLSKENGLALATYIHGTQMILMLILGGISFIITLVKSPKASNQTDSVTHSIPNKNV
ncbi:lysylphosphatidylglycerol synthase transmembrane domain-containing protein [Runella sp. MFBS21]|uniref:lysylphosphatidylglycerol synthase transmembrane domain-containing protein n=1 Tax=Runella sp. MFBS21 TaxID=3034018 RepID=UPI0023F88868|nr:lysylphosphatidylglycerol synthase transmembrane domain-containing protein [Runella sp. MFBS21]MDF7816557.1 lysylphosphatidylglycerol synthase transmembrane domain-containing protein [Runella sp. MFBS21]